VRRQFQALAVIAALAGVGLGGAEAWAQEYQNYYYWPYGSAANPDNGYNNAQLFDDFYAYPREMRRFPQVPGPGYYNFYGGQLIGGVRKRAMWETGHNYRGLGRYLPGPINWMGNPKGQRFYYGNHFRLDVF
jgi:hypothetical protein